MEYQEPHFKALAQKEMNDKSDKGSNLLLSLRQSSIRRRLDSSITWRRRVNVAYS